MDPDAGPRPVVRGLTFLFVLATVLVLVAGVQLFVLSERTDRFFAWTIALPLTAAVDGAFYLGAFFLLFLAARAGTWVEVRAVAWGVLMVSTLKLAATVLTLGPFHFHEDSLTARIAAWGWLAVYVVVPIALVLLIVAELRAPGIDPPATAPMGRALRRFAAVLAAALLGIGAALFAAPAATATRWPWALTDLTARALAAWFAGTGVTAAVTARDGDLVRARPVWAGSIATAVLQIIALARYGNAVEWGDPSAWLYLALVVAVGASGIWGWRAASAAARSGA
jgi:hypothetical protein